jgi:hypothetical protein
MHASKCTITVITSLALHHPSNMPLEVPMGPPIGAPSDSQLSFDDEVRISEYIFVGRAVAEYKVVQSVVEEQGAIPKGNPSTSQAFGNLY